MINISIFDLSITTYSSNIRDYFYAVVNGLYDRLEDFIYLSGGDTKPENIYPPKDVRIHGELKDGIYPYFNPVTALARVIDNHYTNKCLGQKEYPGVVDIYFSSIFYDNISAFEAFKNFFDVLPYTKINLYFVRNHLTETKTLKFFQSFIQDFRDKLEFVILDI